MSERQIFRHKIRFAEVSVRDGSLIAFFGTIWGDQWADTGSPSLLIVVVRWSRYPWLHVRSDWRLIRERWNWPDRVPDGWVRP